MTTPLPTTRLAPSPTGALHLGNARTFLINWAIAKQQNMHIVLRIDDLNHPKVKPNAAQQAIDDLTWLGITWDGPPTYQSHNTAHYNDALEQLQKQNLTYPCTCTRKQIQDAAAAPHIDEHEQRYPNTCRPTNNTNNNKTKIPPDTPHALRLLTPDQTFQFTDHLHGPQSFNPQQHVGDFVIQTKNKTPAYQLAVAIDDAQQNITHVIRGDDLLSSTARQLLIYQYLNLEPIPQYTHLPLVLGQDGHRLAKRHGDTRIAWYREQNVPPTRILALLAQWSCPSLPPNTTDITPQQFLTHFNLQNLPKTPVTFTHKQHQSLLNPSQSPQ